MGFIRILYGSVFIYYVTVMSYCQPIPSQFESQELLVSKTFRVKRQAGYVYDKPSLSFELPTRAPTVSTQAPTVDRTQAQMMYYAYPAPSGGDVVSIGSVAGTSAGSATTAATAATAGYNYAPQNTVSTGEQSTSITDSSKTINTASVQTSNLGSGYGYNAPKLSSGPSTYQTSGTGSAQLTNTGSSQTSSNTGSSGYNYNIPRQSESSSKLGQTVDVSTNAPKYLPPQVGGESSNDAVGSISAGAKTGGMVSINSRPDPSPSDQYLPPITLSNSPAPLAPSGPAIIEGIQTSSRSGAGSTYVPPNRSSSPDNKATPRPFTPAPPPTGYLPPNINNSEIPSQNSPSTPASTYLPPII